MRRDAGLIGKLLSQGARTRELPPQPASTIGQLQQAEQLVPGLRERIEQSGYSEQELADMYDERTADGAIPRSPASASDAPLLLRRPALPLALLFFFALLGYLGVDLHPSAHAHLPSGWAGAAIYGGAALAAMVATDLADRQRRRRRR